MNVYLISCDSFILMGEEINKLVPPSSNVIKYDLRQNTLEDVLNEAGYFSLMDDKKYIIVKGASFFKSGKSEDDSNSSEVKMLENYLKSPNENTIIIFAIYEVPDKRKKIYKLINEQNGYIEVPILNKKDLCYKCMDMAKNNGYKITYEVANFIVENSYTNFDIMKMELDKIFTLLKKGEITTENIKGIISTSVSNKTFAFINAIISRDLKSALDSIKSFEKLKIDPVAVIITLAKEMQIYLNLKCDVSPKDIQRQLGKEDWMMKNYLSNVDNFTTSEIKKIIITLNNYDLGLKSGTMDKSVILDLLAIELCD